MISSHFASHVILQREAVESFERYPFSLPVVRSLDTLELHPKVTFFVGENGSGKSTLLEAIAVSLGFNPEGGTKNFRFGTRSSHSVLHKFIRVAKGSRRPKDGFFLRAESFFNVATEIENLDDAPSPSPKFMSLNDNEIDRFMLRPTRRLMPFTGAVIMALTFFRSRKGQN
jgi:predicted ATPase